MDSQHKIVTINGREVFYWEKNGSLKQVIIFLHGFPGNHLGLVPLAEKMPKDFRVIIPDLPACGQSQDLKGKHNLQAYSDWVEQFMEHLQIEKAILVGHSFGSRVALTFSIGFAPKVQQIILINPVIDVNGFLAKLAAMYYYIGGTLPAPLDKSWVTNTLFKKLSNRLLFKTANKDLHRHIIQQDVLELRRLNPQIFISLFNEFYESPAINLGDKVNFKLLVIASDKDEIATLLSLTNWIAKLPGVSFEILKNAGHLVPIEQPAKVATVIKKHLEKL